MTILSILHDIIIIVFDLCVFYMMVSLKRNSRFVNICVQGGCLLIVAAYFITSYAYKIPTAIASFVCMSVPSFLLFWSVSKHKDARFVLTFFFVDTITFYVAAVARYIGMLIPVYGEVVMLCVSSVICTVIIVAGRNTFSRYHELLEIVGAGWNSLAAASGVIYLVSLVLMTFPKPMIYRQEYFPAYLAFIIAVLFCYNVFVQSIVKTKKIVEQKEMLEKTMEAYRVAYTDPLTNTQNRLPYIERLNDVQRNIAAYKGVTFMMFDVDDFKKLNDEKGHAAGDEALRNVAAVLKSVFAEENVFRLGGDEFAVICPAMQEKQMENKISEFDCRLAELVPQIRVSRGYETMRAAGNLSAEKIMDLADKKMYAMKKQKKVGVAYPHDNL